LSVLENMALRRIFGNKREEAEGWRELYDGFMICTSS
jgi:hypothetical protein